MQDVRVVILAGGKGTRLRPYTTVFPKPLMPIGEIPILGVVLRQLKHFGFRKVTLSVNHLADLIRTFFGDGSKFGLELSYCMEDSPLGTAGSLSLVNDVTENFLVMNGDLLTTMDFSQMMRFHIGSQAKATIGVHPRDVKIDFGVLDVSDNGELIEFKEKPSYRVLLSMGVNAFHRSALDYVPNHQYLDIPTLMTTLKNEGHKVMTFQPECEWLDIGRPDDYEMAVETFEKSKAAYLHGMDS